MKILVVAATVAEIQPLLTAIGNQGILQDGRLTSCSYKNLSVDILITGVGMVATAYHLGKVLALTPYRLALNLGIAGSFNIHLAIGDVVNINMDRFPEQGAQDGDSFLSLEDMNLVKSHDFPFTGGELINQSIIENEILKTIPKVNGITVNTAHGNESSIEKIVGLFHPITESMEGAAFLYGCMMEGIPCAQIRAISNYVERRNKNAWNIPLAIENLNQKAIAVLEDLTNCETANI